MPVRSRRPDAATTLRLLVVVSELEELADWSALGGRIEAARGALVGADGISEADLFTLEQAATRWARLRLDLRAFYANLAPRNATASVALWRILFGGLPLDGWQYGILSRLWEDAVGAPPSCELVPIPRPTTTKEHR